MATRRTGRRRARRTSQLGVSARERASVLAGVAATWPRAHQGRTSAAEAAAAALPHSPRKLKPSEKPTLGLQGERKPRLPKTADPSSSGLREIAISVKSVPDGLKISWPAIKDADGWLIAVTQNERIDRRTLPRGRRSMIYGEVRQGSAAHVAVHARRGKASIARGEASISL